MVLLLLFHPTLRRHANCRCNAAVRINNQVFGLGAQRRLHAAAWPSSVTATVIPSALLFVRDIRCKNIEYLRRFSGEALLFTDFVPAIRPGHSRFDVVSGG